MAVDKTKDGRWYCAWRDPRPPRKVLREYFGRGENAEKSAQLRDLEIKRERISNPKNTRLFGDSISFHDLAQDYINTRHVELAASTISEILRTAAKYALPVIGNLPANRVTIADWTTIEQNLIARGVKARTINKYFQYLSRIFEWAGEREIIRDNPWRRRKPLRMKERFRIELITPGEFQTIFDAADDHLRWAMEVEYNTGLRPGPTELFALKWDDFDYETGMLSVYSSKTDSAHTQYVDLAFLDQLRQRRRFMEAEALRLAHRRGKIEPECPYVISFNGQKVDQLANAWRAAKRRAGITRRIRLYDLRHFYITYALVSGADILDLAHRVGHKDANMIVNVYAHLVEEMRRKEAFRLPVINFSGQKESLLTKTVDQNKKGRQGVTASIVNLRDFNGRGGRI